MIGWHSIRGRLLWLSAAWLTVALLGAWLVIGAVLERFVTTRFDTETAAVADALMAGTAADAQGLAQMQDAPSDPRFSAPLSGWYWQVAADGQVFATSESLYQAQLDGDAGPDGAPLRLTRRDFTIHGSTEALSLTVTAPQAEIDAALSAVRRPLAWTLVVLGLGLGLAVLVQVTLGLSALKAMGRDLRAVRAGETATLPQPDATELQPVAQEINALLAQNREQLARTREQIGNLAHSLKTPLMALQGDMAPDDPGQAMIARMDRQIGWHLKRARSAGGRRVLGQRTPLAPVVEDILLVLRRPVTDSGLEVRLDIPAGLAFAGERQDLEEMIGNLVENAVKWASGGIRISGRAQGTDRLSIAIEDDGPGMSGDDYAQALARGARLDENGPPGTGLGLAIVADLAALHGGRLGLERSASLGGLRDSLDLPG